MVPFLKQKCLIRILDCYNVKLNTGTLPRPTMELFQTAGSFLLEANNFRRKAFCLKCSRVPESASDQTCITTALKNI